MVGATPAPGGAMIVATVALGSPSWSVVRYSTCVAGYACGEPATLICICRVRSTVPGPTCASDAVYE